MSKKFATIVLVGLLAMSTVAVFSTDASAQYSYLGSGWKINTYEHSMSFKVPGSVVNNGSLFFFSDAVWYDNQVVCKNKGGNISFSPGIGLISTEGIANLGLQNGCVNRESGGECTATVLYPNSVAELESDATLLAACNAAVGETDLTHSNVSSDSLGWRIIIAGIKTTRRFRSKPREYARQRQPRPAKGPIAPISSLRASASHFPVSSRILWICSLFSWITAVSHV